MSSIALLLSAIATYWFLVGRTRDLLAPSALLCLFWFGAASLAAVESLKNFNIQRAWEYETYAAVYLSGISMFIGGLFQIPRQTVQPIACESSPQFRSVTTTLMGLSLAAVALRLYVFGFSLDQFSFQPDVADIKNNATDAIPFVHYFEIMTPFLSVAAIFELKSSPNIGKLRRLGLIAYVIYSVAVYSILLNLSRGTLLVIVTGALYIYVRSGSLRFIRLTTLGLLISAGMIGFSFFRLSSEGLVNSFFGEDRLIALLSPIYTYVAFNFENFNSLVRAETAPTYFFYSLKFILWPFMKSQYETGLIQLTDFDTYFFNTRTFIYAFYHDLGLLGCIIFPGFISIMAAFLQNSSINSPGNHIFLMGIQKSIIFTFFGNYFFGELSIFIPLLILFLLSRIYESSARALNQ